MAGYDVTSVAYSGNHKCIVRSEWGCRSDGKFYTPWKILFFDRFYSGHPILEQVGTPGGTGMPAYFGPMLAPFTKQPVMSLADFSERRPAAQQGTPHDDCQEPPSGQCFDKVDPVWSTPVPHLSSSAHSPSRHYNSQIHHHFISHTNIIRDATSCEEKEACSPSTRCRLMLEPCWREMSSGYWLCPALHSDRLGRR